MRRGAGVAVVVVLLLAGCASTAAGLGPGRPWRLAYDGFGHAWSSTRGGVTRITLQPARAASRAETHAALVLSRDIWPDLAAEVRLRTNRQLRSPDPNPWEVGWILWHYTSDHRFYYIALKPNGWELGKADPGYPGDQRFLATAPNPVFPPGRWYTVRVEQRGDGLEVDVDGRRLVRFTDSQDPYLSGRVGLYAEDASVTFQPVTVGPAPLPHNASDCPTPRTHMSTGQAPTKRVMVIYGTRPEAIKLAPVIRAIAASPRLRPVVTLTGQHQIIVEQVNSMFGIRPDHDLDVIRPGQSLHGLTARVLERLSPALQQERPDAVVVQGDTTSAFAGALTAFYEHVPVVHVEAGLRTGDLYSPFPEEANRRLTGQIATLHLAPTPVSERNLLRDGIPSRSVLVTGNTVIDALLWTVRQRVPYGDPALEAVDSTDAPVLLVTTHRRESWGQRMRDIASAVARLARKHPDLVVVLPLHPNPIVREALLPALQGLDNVMLVEPMGYGAFARLLQRSTIVLTDSGGIQEEAPSLGKPVLVMRDTTERPEAVSAGTARLVGTDPDRVYSEVDRLLTCPRAYKTMANAVNPYGDGRAAQRTTEAIEHMFGLGGRPVPFRR